MDLSTCRFARSGSQGSTDSSSRNLHSSTRIIAAAAVIGLVSEAMRKIVLLVSRRPLNDSSGLRQVQFTLPTQAAQSNARERRALPE